MMSATSLQPGDVAENHGDPTSSTKIRQRRGPSYAMSNVTNTRQPNTSQRDRLLHNIQHFDQFQVETQLSRQHEQNKTLQTMNKAYYQAVIFIMILSGSIMGALYLGTFYYNKRNSVASNNINVYVPRRMIMSIYPTLYSSNDTTISYSSSPSSLLHKAKTAITIKQALPVFYGPYTLATPKNAEARLAVQHMLKIRIMAKDNGGSQSTLPWHRKPLLNTFHSWELVDFSKQIDSVEKADGFCGKGFYRAFFVATGNDESNNNNNENNGNQHQQRLLLQQDLMTWCLMATSYHDAYIDFGLTPLSVMTRGTSGIIAKYANENRLYALFVYLPKPAKEILVDRSVYKGGTAWHDSQIPDNVLQYLIRQGQQGDVYDRRNLEEYLYKIIIDSNVESNKWIIWTVTCSYDEQQEYDQRYLRMATTCHDNTNESNSDGCCTLYDTLSTTNDQRMITNNGNRNSNTDSNARRELRGSDN